MEDLGFFFYPLDGMLHVFFCTCDWRSTVRLKGLVQEHSAMPDKNEEEDELCPYQSS